MRRKLLGRADYVLENDAAAHLFDAIRVVTLGGQYFRELDAADGTARLTSTLYAGVRRAPRRPATLH